MSAEILSIVMLVVMVILILAGAPIAFVLGAVAAIFAFIAGEPLLVSLFPDRLYTTMTSFPFEAVTLFILMGVVLERAKVANRLFEAFYMLVGRFKGGLYHVTMLMSVMFAASTGISGAAAVAIGLIALPTMLKHNYEKELSSGIICSGAGLGVIIPPSIMLILYGPSSGVSVAALFAAAMIPGLVLAGIYSAYSIVRCMINPEIGPPALEKDESTENIFLVLVRDLLPTFGLIVAVLGSILIGIASPTEAASVGVVGAILLCLGYGQLNLNIMKQTLWATLKTVGFIFAIAIGANFFTTTFMGLGGGNLIHESILGLNLGSFGTVVLLLAILFVLGMIMDWIAILLVFIPIIRPIITAYGIDPLWFAILFCITLQISYVTPPFSYSVFYLKGVAPSEVSLMDIYRGVMPFIPLQILGLILVYVFPSLATWLPTAIR